jgi:ketosteroid isomerase-like protein
VVIREIRVWPLYSQIWRPPVHPHAQLIHQFYTAFQNRDAVGMAACYHTEVIFSDPVFQHLEGQRAVAMWQMFCARAEKSGLRLEFSNVQADDHNGCAHWDARYTFSQTGRAVLNHIDAAFTFQDGKIVRHTDTFDLWRWAGMALGVPGYLLGWTPMVQASIRTRALHGLDAFIQKQGLKTHG